MAPFFAAGPTQGKKRFWQSGRSWAQRAGLYAAALSKHKKPIIDASPDDGATRALVPRPSWRDGNRIHLLQNGEAFFPALCAAIDGARRYVHLETYIFNIDVTGLKVLDHLRMACQRGVKVRVALDGFGCFETVGVLRERLEEMGAQVRVYRPEPTGWRWYRFSLGRLRRLHRKMTVVDDAIGFVGGLNILDDYVDVPNQGGELSPRFDFAVRIEGPLLQDLIRAQDELWVRLAWRHSRHWREWYQRFRLWQASRNQKIAARLPRFQPGLRAALLLRDNLRYRKTIEDVYVKALSGASREIVIANSYFFPGRRLRQALKHAALRGVRVQLLLQGHAEYPLQHWASRNLYGPLLRHGIALYEYQPSYLHAKVAVIDDCAMVGSSNMDPFSLLLAREANVWIDDADFSAQLRQALAYEIDSHSRQMTLGGLKKVSVFARALNWLAYRLLRIGVALTGKGSEY